MTTKGILPTNAIPSHYDLTFDVDLKNFKYSGKETIDLVVRNQTSEIVLNAVDLEVKLTSVMYKKKSLKASIKLDNEKEILTLKFPQKFRGPVKLMIEFTGNLNDDLLGFYRSKYTLRKKEKYLATTQFEAPYARRCFPCFDEPEYKATFDVTLKIDKNLRAISNMPIKEEIKQDNKKIVRFHRTPKMSTYLLYLGVGEFEFLEDKLGKTLIRIATVPGKKAQGKFALELTKKFLSYFQEYSGVPYPLPKLDMIALPDFVAGAMENWGAITFREIYLLFDPKTTSTTLKKRVAMIIAHEIWHQWSGNLVTMRWWNDLWLNESFATFMSYKAVDHFFPDWNMWEDFVGEETESAFTEDSIKSTHPIDVDVKDPNQIEEIFDAISYSKGGSILRMIEGYLGEETFRKGVTDYLSQYKYSNATSADLWSSLAKASNKPIKQITERWIRQVGYPLVESNLEDNNLLLQQKRFVFNHKDNTLWPIPLVIKTDDKLLIELLDKQKKTITLEKIPEWFKINEGQTGFYRVSYPDNNLLKLKFLIPDKVLNALDRWGIQNDLFELSRNGEITLDKYLDFSRSYFNEDNYLVLADIYQNLRAIYFVFSEEAFRDSIWPRFKNYHTGTFRRIIDKLGWEPKKNESQKDSLLRELAIRYCGFVEDPDILNKVKEKFEGYLKKQELHPDIRSPVFSIMAANGDEKVFKNLVNLYSKTQSPDERRMVLIALGQFKDSKLLNRVLDFSLSKKVRTQDLVIIIPSVASNPYSRAVLLPWVKKNWKKIEKYQKSGKLFIRLLEAIIGSSVSREKEKELRKFFKSHPVKYKMTLDRSFERVERNISWLEKNKAILAQYFS